MIIIESVKEQLEKNSNTLEIIKECLWLTKITGRIAIFERWTTKTRLF